MRKYVPNTELCDVRPEGNLQADDEIIIPQDDLCIISWETEFEEFPPYPDTGSIPDDSPINSDQQDDINRDLDLRSTRRDANSDDNAATPRAHQNNDIDSRSTGPNKDTDSAVTEQPAENSPDADLRSNRPQSNTDTDIDEMPFKSPSEMTNSDFSNSSGRDISVPDLSKREDDEKVTENESPRGGKYILRPNPTPNFTDEYRY